MSVYAVLGFFRNERCIIVGRSSPASARVSALSDRKKCVVNAVRFPTLRACSAFDISGADMGVFPLIDVLAFDRWKVCGERYTSVGSSLVQTARMGHVVMQVMSFSTVMR